VELSADDRAVLRQLPGQLKAAMLAGPEDPSLRRLHPPAYTDNPEAAAEFRQLVGEELDESRSQALGTLESTADATELTEEQMYAWLRALNAIRLWLGTVLDVGEDDDVEELQDAPHLLYQGLTWLQSLVVDALAGET